MRKTAWSPPSQRINHWSRAPSGGVILVRIASVMLIARHPYLAVICDSGG